MSEIYFIRHAQASYMAANYDKLSPKGETQSAILGKYLAERNILFDQTFVGALVRQKETQTIVSDSFNERQLNFPAPEVIASLNEHHGPRALKLSYERLLKEDQQVQEWFPKEQDDTKTAKKKMLLIFKYFMTQWVKGKIDVPHPEVESWSHFRTRVKSALDHILTKTEKKTKVGVFTSGGVIAAITAEALGIKEETKIADLNYAIRNTSISKFFYSEGAFNLLSLNEVPHLEKEMITFV